MATVGTEIDSPLRLRRRTPLVWLLAVLTAAALVIDAVVHLKNAGMYAGASGGIFNEGNIFRAQGVVALIAAALVLALPRLFTFAFAAIVLATAAAAVITYTYVEVGSIGPIPDMYNPTWETDGKKLSAIAESVGAVVAVVGAWVTGRSARSARQVDGA